jgi:hypothetical protein
MKPFSNGTRAIAETLAKAKNVQSILGGGDTIEAIKRFGYEETDFTFVSTGGGAMLEFLEGKTLPGVEVLMEKENVKNESKTITKAKSSKKPAKKVPKKVAKKSLKKSSKKPLKKTSKKNAGKKKTKATKESKKRPALKKNAAAKKKGKKRR